MLLVRAAMMSHLCSNTMKRKAANRKLVSENQHLIATIFADLRVLEADVRQLHSNYESLSALQARFRADADAFSKDMKELLAIKNIYLAFGPRHIQASQLLADLCKSLDSSLCVYLKFVKFVQCLPQHEDSWCTILHAFGTDKPPTILSLIEHAYGQFSVPSMRQVCFSLAEEVARQTLEDAANAGFQSEITAGDLITQLWIYFFRCGNPYGNLCPAPSNPDPNRRLEMVEDIEEWARKRKFRGPLHEVQDAILLQCFQEKLLYM